VISAVIAMCFSSKEKCICHPPGTAVQKPNSVSSVSMAKESVEEMMTSCLQFYKLASMAPNRAEVSECYFLRAGWWYLAYGTTVSCRVEMQKMRVMRPSADVARYTMIFHNRDHGNEENRER